MFALHLQVYTQKYIHTYINMHMRSVIHEKYCFIVGFTRCRCAAPCIRWRCSSISHKLTKVHIHIWVYECLLNIYAECTYFIMLLLFYFFSCMLAHTYVHIFVEIHCLSSHFTHTHAHKFSSLHQYTGA